MDNLIRLHKYLADCGCCSRRQAEKLIEQGKVTVNGITAVIGQAIIPDVDKISVDKKPVHSCEKKHTYIMMYKPRGYVTTMSDELDRKCVKDLLKEVNSRVFPIGRLDRDSEGMLLFTDDGDLANKISSPKTHVPKTYRVTVNGMLSDEALSEMVNGMTIDSKTELLPAGVFIKSSDEERTVLSITIYEGKNRQIRRMCEQLGLTVKLLKRENIGQLRLGKIKPGEIRFLDDDEIRYLKSLCSK